MSPPQKSAPWVVTDLGAGKEILGDQAAGFGGVPVWLFGAGLFSGGVGDGVGEGMGSGGMTSSHVSEQREHS